MNSPSPGPRLARIAFAASAVIATLVACGPDVRPTPTPTPAPAPPDAGTSDVATDPPGSDGRGSGDGGKTVDPPPGPPPVPPPPPDLDEAKRQAAKDLEENDALAQDLLRRFRERIWDPGRDGLSSAEGEIALVVDGKSGVFRFTFDGSRKDDEQVAVTPVSADEGLHSGAAAQAKRWAILAVRGPYHTVLRALPPLGMRVVSPGEGSGRIVVVPPFRSEIGTSYRLGEDDLVALRGDTDGKRREIARYTWRSQGGKSVLLRTDFGEDAASTGSVASIACEYEDREGIPALASATLSEGAHRCEGKLTYRTWVRR